ncbi:MAG: fibronectin type III domain-containing protein, partial [Bacteroidales bacterium]|nr:fibronectin type III domain-containing protein [Bacteroidales bacterium]
MKKLFLFLMMAVMLSGVKAQEQVTIGTGTQYSNYMAIPGYFGYHSSAYLYTSDEMPQGGVTISSLSFETQSVSAGSNRALKIWLKEVSDEEIPASIVLNDLLEGATLVYDHTNVPIAESWNEFLFDSDFLYSGAGNLLVICDGIGCSGGGGCSAYLKYDQTIQNKGWNRGNDYSPVDHTTSQARINQYRPNVKFTILPVTGDFCAPIANMEVSNIQMNTADITWEGTAVSYTYELKLQNEEWTSENVVIGTADSPFVTLTDLSPMTKYSVRIKAVCADGNESSYMSKNFKTACNDVITSLPYVENFSNGLDCWTIMRESYNSSGDYVGPMIET